MPFETHEHITTPPDDTVIWRYMDLARFMQLLESRELWFSRSDQFDDPLEGTLTDGEFLYEPATAGSPAVYRNALSDPMALMIRPTSYINCWRIGAGESLAMWDLYGKGSGIVAITSTVRRLKQQLSRDSRKIHLAEVRYVNWSAPNTLRSMYDMITRKEISYAHEAEMRAFYWDIDAVQSQLHLTPDKLPLGFTFPVLLQELLTEIWTGPREKSWVHPLVEKIVSRYSLDVPVKASNRMMTRRLMQHKP